MQKYIALGAIAVVIAGAAFWSGISYGKGSTSARGQFTGAGGTFARQGGMAGARGGFVSGQILSRDAASITLKMQNGSTAIALISSSTEIVKSVAGSAADLPVGANVVVTGAQNSDGSITAQSVQRRLADPAARPMVPQSK